MAGRMALALLACTAAADARRLLQPPPLPPVSGSSGPPQPQQLSADARGRYDPIFNPIIAVDATKANAFAARVAAQNGDTSQAAALAQAAVPATTTASSTAGSSIPTSLAGMTDSTALGGAALSRTAALGPASDMVAAGAPAGALAAAGAPFDQGPMGTGALQAGSGSFSTAYAPGPPVGMPLGMNMGGGLSPAGSVFPGRSNSLAGSQSVIGTQGAAATQQGLSGTSTQQLGTSITGTRATDAVVAAAPAPVTAAEASISDSQQRWRSWPQFQATADGLQVNQPVVQNPDGVTSGGNLFKAGTKGVTLGNSGTGGSIQFANGGGITVDPGKAGSLWALAKQAAALYG